MFELTKSFKSREGFQITPILMDGQPVFMPQEIEERLGYVDLSDSIHKSEGFKEGVDYVVVEGEKLEQIRNILRRSNTPLQISPKARSLTLITESGFWGVAFRSNKPECIALRIWVTSEVLPAIRKTGTYGAAGPDVSLIAKAFIGTKRLAKANGLTELQARAKAAEHVQQVYQVDVHALLGIKPPQVLIQDRQRDERIQALLLALLHEFGSDQPVTVNRILRERQTRPALDAELRKVEAAEAGFSAWKFGKLLKRLVNEIGLPVQVQNFGKDRTSKSLWRFGSVEDQ